MLHASDVESQSEEKIEPFLKIVFCKFQDAFYPFENVSINEMVIGWKGLWKYHIKTFDLCDSTTGYIYHQYPLLLWEGDIK